MLLIHPPVSKPGECPAGIAKLSGALHTAGIEHTLIDANLEGMLFLMQSVAIATDTWTRRALRNLPANIEEIRTPAAFASIDRYTQVVNELNRVLMMAGRPFRAHVSLGNFQYGPVSAVRSDDLLWCAENPEQNPFYAYYIEKIIPFIQNHQPAAIGISLNYLSQALCAFALIGVCRRHAPGLPIILGGGLATSWLSRPSWRNPFRGLIDDMVAGPGEEYLIKRFASRSAGSAMPSDTTPADDTATAPIRHHAPYCGSLPIDRYLSPGFVLPYSASQGCFWRQCSFCPEKAEGNAYRPVPVGQVLSNIAGTANYHTPALVHFLDNAMSPRLLATLAESERIAPWYGFARFTDHLLDMDFCHALRRSGCVMLKLGIESGDQGVLDALHKGIDLDKVIITLGNLKRAGIGVYAYFLFGTVAETIHEARRTLDFIAEQHEYIDFINAAIFNLPVSGPDADALHITPYYEGDLSLYADFRHPHGWDRISVRQFLDREFRRAPAIGAILRRTPPFFTSNHAPFFLQYHCAGYTQESGDKFACHPHAPSNILFDGTDKKP